MCAAFTLVLELDMADLAVLHRGRLVDKRRSGRAVLYQTTTLGLALLGDGSASPGASAS